MNTAPQKTARGLAPGQTAVTEWRKLLTHFEWAEGFSFITLFAPDSEGARIRLEALERFLAAGGRRIISVRFSKPDDLKLLANRLFELDPPADAGAIWVETVTQESDEDFEMWEAAWREGAARLNQYRNPLRRKFDIPLIFVAAKWVQPILRGMSPDLWSVRDLVVDLVSAQGLPSEH